MDLFLYLNKVNFYMLYISFFVKKFEEKTERI